MTATLTLAADLRDHLPGSVELPTGVRGMTETDGDELAALYFESYEPGVACASPEEAADDVAASFQGEYGEFWWDASLVAVSDERIVSAVMTVRQAPWPDTPPGPFIIELFTHRGLRRRGLARTLVESVIAHAGRADRRWLGLRVMTDNAAAIGLYRSLGFATYPPSRS